MSEGKNCIPGKASTSFNQANKKAKGSDSKTYSAAGKYIVMYWEFFNKSVSVAIYEFCKIVSEFHYVFGASGLQKLGL